MINKIVKLAIVMLFLSCGGGGGSDNDSPQPETNPVFHKITRDSISNSMTAELKIENNEVIDLVKDDQTTVLPMDQVKMIHWNGQCGWPFKSVEYASGQAIVITGLDPSGDTGLLTIESITGEIYSLNVDFLELNGFQKNESGLIFYGDGEPECPPPPEPNRIVHKIIFDPVAGSVNIELAIECENVACLVRDGQVSEIPVDQVEVIHWNGQCGWPIASAVFTENLTIIAGLNSSGDTGLVSVETKTGDIYYVNLDFVETNGVIDKDAGLIAYGDGDSECEWE